MTDLKTEPVKYIEAMVAQYMETALWAGLIDAYDPEDIAPETVAVMVSDCASFCAENLENLNGIAPGQCGHDFWLTRCGHGAGFWDRGLGDRGDKLTESGEVYGNVDLYEGDDGKIYAQ